MVIILLELSWQIEVLVEDQSGAVILDAVLTKYLRHNAFSPTDLYLGVRPHKGVGKLSEDLNLAPKKHSYGLLHLLPAKIRAYEAVFKAENLLLVVVLDLDEEDKAAVYELLLRTLDQLLTQNVCVLGIAVEELEAWLLGDFAAIKKAYPQAYSKYYYQYQQDSIGETWEHLAWVILGPKVQKLIRLGYPAVGAAKNNWAKAIAPHLDLQKNSSPSLQRFLQALDEALTYLLATEEITAQVFY